MISNSDKYTILVSGATGRQGNAVAKHLLKKGFNVRALTRNLEQESAETLVEQGVEIIEGNFDEPASLHHALDGIYGAYSVQNTKIAGVEGEIRQGKAFANAAKDANIKHFVYSSVGGAERKTRIPHFDSKWEIEKHIRSLNLPATILRPVFFMDNWNRFKEPIFEGKLSLPLSPDTPLQQIAVDDIGAFVALAFSHPSRWLGQTAEIAGDELTMTETAKIFSEITDKEVQYQQVPWDIFEEQAGKGSFAMHRWFEHQGYKADIKELNKEYPDLKSLKKFLRDTGW